MQSILHLFLLFTLIFIINSQSTTNDINQNVVVYKKTMNLFRWNNGNKSLGQISGLAMSSQQLYVFHRGSREWNEKSFPDGYHFDRKNFPTIEQKTILSIDTQTGEIIDEWGNDSFYMPHGLNLDQEENLWLTDVAMHQVIKYKNGQRMLSIGEVFTPGDDSFHFCKPTDVLLSDDNLYIYVADGYCNSRISKFHSNGTFIRQYQIPKGERQLFIPHSLTLIQSLHLICVADRQNGRIVCFDTDYPNEGKVKYIIEHSSMNTVYAITSDSKKNLLFAVSGRDLLNQAQGFTFSIHPDSFGRLLQTWKPAKNFGEPHDLALSVDGRSLFVAEMRPNRIHLFDIIN